MTSPTDKDNILDQICRIAQEAGEIVLDLYSTGVDIKVEEKKDQSPVTQADIRAHRHIYQELANLTPSVMIVSEEGEMVPHDLRKQVDQMWMVDPLDGTREFINRTNDFTINIALIQKNQVILGVVHAPVHGQTYLGRQGQPSFMQEGQNSEVLKCPIFEPSKSGMRFGVSRSFGDPKTMAFIQSHQNPELIARGSSLKFMDLCRGKIDCYPRLQSLKEWDTAAAQVIVEGAGGKVVDLNGRSLTYNSEDLIQKPFIAFRDQ